MLYNVYFTPSKPGPGSRKCQPGGVKKLSADMWTLPKTFHLSYCKNILHKVDIFIVRIFSIIFDFVPSVSKTIISSMFINIFATFFLVRDYIFLKYLKSFKFLSLIDFISVMCWKKSGKRFSRFSPSFSIKIRCSNKYLASKFI